MDDSPPIDAKDEPGEYRTAVRDGVYHEVGAVGRPITRRNELVGTWLAQYPAGRPRGDDGPGPVYHLHPDGTYALGHDGKPVNPGPSTWRLNRGSSISLLDWCPPIPEFGVDAGMNEGRYFVATLPDGRMVWWNGDGSLVQVLTRQDDPGSEECRHS